ncbi:hypothetical protein ACVITL_005270 [Rhizobium pisi]
MASSSRRGGELVTFTRFGGRNRGDFFWVVQ